MSYATGYEKIEVAMRRIAEFVAGLRRGGRRA
jgi:hypothetical protein